MRYIQLYPPDRDDKIIKTGNGPMTYIDFLMSEKARIERNPKRKVVLKRRFGFSWLMVNKVTKRRKTTGNSYRPLLPHGQKHVMSV